MPATAAPVPAIAMPPQIALATAKMGAAAFTSMLAQLAPATEAVLRPAPSAAPARGTARQPQAVPQKSDVKPHHPASQPVMVAPVASGQAITVAPPAAPAEQMAVAATADANGDAEARDDDTIGDVGAAPPTAGPPAPDNRHQSAADAAERPDAAPIPPSHVTQGPDAGAGTAVATPQGAMHAEAAGSGAALVAPVIVHVAPGAAAASTATPTAPVTAPPTAATQVAQAISIHVASGAPAQITIHLQPAELGAVQVRIERGHDGSATITLQVERADTLHTLQVDLPHLHQALDRAGVPADARQVSMELAQAPPPASGAGTGGEGHRQDQAPRARPREAAQGTPEEIEEPVQRWRAAGINITA